MRDYRAYILGIEDHRFIRVDEFLSNHRDDVAALNAAKQLTDKHDVEVWDGGRFVARLSLGEELVSPGLVPSLVSALPSDSETNAVKSPAEPVSLSRVSELAASSESNPFLR